MARGGSKMGSGNGIIVMVFGPSPSGLENGLATRVEEPVIPLNISFLSFLL